MSAAKEDRSAEPVRLVIWDLDETFWRGTLSEGGIEEYLPEHSNIVIELARRGIVSTICSKNNFESARVALQDQRVWDYFVLPSIDWTPKGHRVAALIKAFQLRPETVLFVDDNPGNRAEAAAAAQGLQTHDARSLAQLLADPRLGGQADVQCTRLEQYKMLARRRSELLTFSGDNADFLRGSDICVSLETDVERHLDRAVELINRTNQLNFTKLRLPSDPALARQHLADHIGAYYVQAGLVRVSDKYGDYGFCGFYSKQNDNNAIRGRLIHFCFSCRIMGLGVEHWVYDKLGRPPYRVDGEIHNSLGTDRRVDWIRLENHALDTPSEQHRIPEIRLRGGCELTAMSHYFGMAGNVALLETNYSKDELILIRKDFSDLLLNSLEGPAALREDCEAVGIDASDFESGFFSPASPGSLLVYSGWGDLELPLYRHRDLPFRIPCPIESLRWQDATRLTNAEIAARLAELPPESRDRFHRHLEALRGRFTFSGPLTEEDLAQNLLALFGRIPPGTVLALVLPDEHSLASGSLQARPRASMYNALVRSLAAGRENVVLASIGDAARNPSDKLQGADHFHRLVYVRLARALLEEAGSRLMALRAKSL